MVLFSFVLIGLCLGAFLYYIVDYFKTDKKAYLYEEAFRFGIEASASLNRGAAFGTLLAESLDDQKKVSFRDLQENLIALRIQTIDQKNDPTWTYNRATLKELGLPEIDFLGSYEQKNEIKFLPTADFKNGYFKISNISKNYKSVLALYPEDFFALLSSRKFAKVSIVDNATKTVVFKSPKYPEGFNPVTLASNFDQPKSFDKDIGEKKYFITSHFSKITNTSLIILYDMDEANTTLAFLSKTLIWAAIGMFGFGIVLSTLFAKSLSRPIEVLAQMARRISEGDMEARVNLKNTDETGLLAASFNNMMDKIQAFIEELKGKARLESELKLASLVQRNLFDLTPMDNDYFKLEGDYISASECAGDWWCVRNWDGKYVLLLGDATGHGAACALLTSAVFAAVECIKPEITKQDKWWEKPDELLYPINRVVLSLSKEIMMTFIAGVYDPESKKMWLANASHEAPLYYDLENPPQSISDLKFILSDVGPRLGDSLNPKFVVNEIQIKPHQRILFYTDGLVESLVDPGKKFSERYFLKRILQIGNRSTKESSEMLVTKTPGMLPNDDISYFIMDFKGDAKKTDLTLKAVHEKVFSKKPNSNQFGFLVGDIDSFGEERLNFSLVNEWSGSLLANKERSRSVAFDNYISALGKISSTVKDRLRLCIDELIMNGEIHGNSHAVMIHLERTNTGFWVKSKDMGGTFENSAAERLYSSVFLDTLTPRYETPGSGAGIGLGMIVKMSDHFQIRIIPSKETIVSCFIPDKIPHKLTSFSYLVHPN